MSVTVEIFVKMWIGFSAVRLTRNMRDGTFHRFIRRHERRMPVLFAQVVQLAMKMGLAKLGRIAIDGSRMKANTSKHKAMSYERMGPAIEQLKNDLALLKRDLKQLNREELNFSELPDEIKRRQERLAKIAAAKAALEADKGNNLKPKDQKSFHDHDAMPMAGKSRPQNFRDRKGEC